MKGIRNGNWSMWELGELPSDAPSPGDTAEGFRMKSIIREGDDVNEP